MRILLNKLNVYQESSELTQTRVEENHMSVFAWSPRHMMYIRDA